MIRPIQITLNAAHPELPLVEASTFVGSPSTAFVRGVPATVGSWSITAVRLVFAYPDNSVVTANCVNAASGVWVGTIAPTATSGRTANGYQVLADGIDENGNAVTGYVLGMGDLAVYTRDMTIDGAAGVKWYLHYFDTAPATPRKGDVIPDGNGGLQYYNGTAWMPFTSLANYYTKEQTDAAIDRVAAYYITYDAAGNPFPTYAALANATTVYSGGSVRVPTRNDYCVVLADETHDNAEYRYIYAVAEGEATGSWQPQFPIETNDYGQLSNKPSINGNTLTGNKTGADLGLLDTSAVVAPSTDSSASGKAADAKATGDALELVAPEWASGSSYAAYDAVKYNGAYYYAKSDIAANTAWNANNWGSLANLAALAHLFLPLTGGTLTGDLVISLSNTERGLALTKNSALGNFDWRLFVDNSSRLVFYSLGDWYTVILRRKDGTIALLSDIGIPAFDSTATYAVGAKVVYSNAVWNCTTEVSTAGAWTGTTNWTKLFDLAVDSTPTANSASLMTSGAIKTTLDGKANRASPSTAGNLAALDASGNPTDSTIPAANVAVKGEIPYILVTKTINNGAVSLDDRASNSVTVSATLSPNTLTINFPTAPTGKLRDFAMRLNIAAGVTAPEIAWPQGVTLENNGGEVPEIADGGTGGSSTILYFSESENNGTTAKFTVKGETLTAIAQA